MKQVRRRLLVAILAVVAAAAIVVTESAAAPAWRPARPVTVIVPWPAGGSTDLTARILSSQMERFLGQRIVIVNTPGAQGAIGMKDVWDAPRDGYTWGANASTDMVSYPVLGRLTQTHRDWAYFYTLWAPNVIVVPANSPIKDVNDLVAAMKARPGQVSVASAGAGSSGHLAAETFRLLAGTTYRHVAYAGGAPAVLSTVSGETEAVMQLSLEVSEMLRAKRLRALAVMSRTPLEIEGYGVIPALAQYLPKTPEVGSFFGIIVPKTMPAEILVAIEAAFRQGADQPALKRFAKDRGVQAVILSGKAADEATELQARRVAWTLFDAGLAQKNPSEFNIPRP